MTLRARIARRWLDGNDIICGADAPTDATKAVVMSQAKPSAPADAGSWTMRDLLVAGAVVVAGIVVWPHAKEWL